MVAHRRSSSASQPRLAPSSEVLGRAFEMFISTDSSCAAEPRGLVGDGQDTEQVFGANVDARTPNGTDNGLSEVKVRQKLIVHTCK